MNPLTTINSQIFNALKQELGEEFLRELVDTYCHDSDQQLLNLHKALDNGDKEGFIRAAHSLKSASLTFGALAFGDLARELELSGREGNLEDSREKFQQLREACSPLQKGLKDMCHASSEKK